MTTGVRESEAETTRRLAGEYAGKGYDVAVTPDPAAIPFDLEGYRPDLLAEKDGEHLVIEVRTSGTRLSVDRFTRIAREVSRHPGWRFLLVTADDVPQDGLPEPHASLVPWDELRSRAEVALKLSSSAPAPVALLSLWAVLEGILRRYAERVALPVERLPTSVLIKHLYSHGEISMHQYDAARTALQVRNRVAHGYEASDLTAAVSQVESLVRGLLHEWNPDRRVA